MNKFSKIIAVTIVTALFISLSAFSSYAFTPTDGIFTPTPKYPYAETLKYGSDSLVIDINYSTDPNRTDYWFYRYQCNSDAYFYVQRRLSNNNYIYTLYIWTDYPVYTYVVNSHTGYGSDDYALNPYEGYDADKKYLFMQSVSFSTEGLFKFRATENWRAPSNFGGEGFDVIVNDVWVYPSSSYVQQNNNFSVLSSELNNGFTMIDNRLSEGFSNINDSITKVADGIVNAGSDKPTLDTNNDWMNDSLTKVNQWVSSIDSFKEEMNKAKEDNAQNMEQAGNFLSGFFDVLPTGILAVLSLVLVIIVVVKVIGR